MKEEQALKYIESLAETARIGLNSAEKSIFPREISAILNMAEVLKEVDTQGVAPTIYPVEGHMHLREDIVRPSLSPEEALANGPDVVKGYFRVPRVIEEDV